MGFPNTSWFPLKPPRRVPPQNNRHPQPQLGDPNNNRQCAQHEGMCFLRRRSVGLFFFRDTKRTPLLLVGTPISLIPPIWGGTPARMWTHTPQPHEAPRLTASDCLSSSWVQTPKSPGFAQQLFSQRGLVQHPWELNEVASWAWNFSH